MKRIPVVFLCALVLAALPALSQTQPGSFEFSVAGNIGSYSTSNEMTYGGQTSTSEPEAQSYFGLDIRVGAYLVEGLSIEPEIYILAIEKSLPALNLGGNLSYTFTIPESPVKPFVLAGYGVGNGVPVMQRLMGRASDKLDIPVLRAGGGLKFFLSKQVALKVEYRYERYTIESTTSYYYYSYSYKEVQNYHNVLFGFSVFLPAAQ